MARIQSYETRELRVLYDPARCIHAAECVRGLPSVFDTRRRPWVEPAAAPAQDVVEVIEPCPTGALQYERLDGADDEVADSANTVMIRPNGPLYVRGQVRIVDTSTGESRLETRVALCRCGASQNKPFCDGAHTRSGFRDAGAIAPGIPEPAELPGPGELTVEVTPNSPLHVTGPFTIHSRSGAHQPAVEAWLCRCGGSLTRPFCDGTHRTNHVLE